MIFVDPEIIIRISTSTTSRHFKGTKIRSVTSQSLGDVAAWNGRTKKPPNNQFQMDGCLVISNHFSMVKIQNHPSDSQWNLELDVSGDCFLKEDVSGLGNLMWQHFPDSDWRNFQWTQMFLLAQTLISRWLYPRTFNLDTQNGQNSISEIHFP